MTLPNTTSDLYLTDGGLETTLVFLEGFDLPCFAAFDLLKNEKGYAALKNYYRRYLKIAKDFNTGYILDTPTWRANPDWIEKIGYPASALEEVNAKAVQLLEELKEEFKNSILSIVLNGVIGPRGDGYRPENLMTAAQAEQYHSIQLEAFSRTAIDMVSAITMNYVEEAIGITLAAAAFNLPVVISFTVETDGKLPTGMSLGEAIEQVDQSVEKVPVYYMINCAHPSHFSRQLQGSRDDNWTKRIRGLRANASRKSHAELDESTELDRGNPEGWALENKQLKELFQHLNVFGGCCGTDEEHVHEMVKQVKSI